MPAMTLIKNPRFFGPLLTLLFVAICLLAIFAVREDRPAKTGVAAYLEQCGKTAVAKDCDTLTGISAAFGFDLLSEIQSDHSRMQDTAKKIANGELTEAAYQDCLKAGKCAAVPLLDHDLDPESLDARKPENVRISRLFWSLAEGDRMNEDICGLIPVCAAALSQKVILLKDGKVVEAAP